MGNQKKEVSIGSTEGLPSLLALFDTILFHQGCRIRESSQRRFKAHPMLAQVAIGLGLIPLEPSFHICYYNFVLTSRRIAL